jgi:hypothetical protein
MKTVVYQITAPPDGKRDGYCAGILFKGEQMISAAPILHWMIRANYDLQDVESYCSYKGFEFKLHEPKKSNGDEETTAAIPSGV